MASAGGSGIPAPGELPGYTPPGEAPWGGGRSPEYSQEDPMLVANSVGGQGQGDQERPTSALGQLVHYIKRYFSLTNLFTGDSSHHSKNWRSVFNKLIPKWFSFLKFVDQLLWSRFFFVQSNSLFPV